ncbi:hypothetical protein PIB30_032732 [Stylosanthes scabra]|uniref:Uncharacterized protein n=1 Tax=Stylosanthes scabra TaxID=79078 RepID=A0ABU6SC93_9FABA|nr:hypothetical protein [Stylosanthes scabra]
MWDGICSKQHGGPTRHVTASFPLSASSLTLSSMLPVFRGHTPVQLGTCQSPQRERETGLFSSFFKKFQSQVPIAHRLIAHSTSTTCSQLCNLELPHCVTEE